MRAPMCMIALGLTGGCKELTEADPALAEALVTMVRDFDGDDEALAPRLRAIERQMYLTLDVVSANEVDRSVRPDPIAEEDVEHYEERPVDRDPAGTLAVATAGVSAHDLGRHATIPAMEDQRPVEPQSPEFYERTWLEGRTCWEPRDCLWMRTHQELTKEYGLGIAVTYQFFKDFRWVDLHADLPAEEPRWAYVARSWNDDSYSSENGRNTIWQSYTVEFWYPRDGRGFRWEDHELGEGEIAKQGDSDGGGTLRMLSLWTETELAISASEQIQEGTIRWGTNQNYKAVEKFLDDEFGPP